MDNAAPSSSSAVHNTEPELEADALPATAERFRSPTVNDICETYHPRTGRPTRLHSFEEYKSERQEPDPDALDDQPWKPFRSRADFEFAELTLEARMNRGQIDRLIAIVDSIVTRQSAFSFKGYSDVDAAWQLASAKHPTVCP